MTSWKASGVFSSSKVFGFFMSGGIFRAREKFRVNSGRETPVRFSSVSDSFLYHFGMFSHGVEQQVVLLECHVLAKEFTSTQEMFDAIGGPDDENSFTTVPEAYTLLLAHAEDKPNSLLSTTHGNIFFLQGRHGRAWIMIFSWCKDAGWWVTFCEGLIPHNWLQGTRVFSRHKLKRVV